MGRQPHCSITARVTDSGAVTEAFAMTNGMKEVCVLAPTLFSLMFSVMLIDAYRDEHPGIFITYRTDDHPVSHRRMHSQSRVSTTAAHELLFANDCALNVTSEEDMQKEHGSLRRRLRELRSHHQHGEDGGYAPTATQNSPQRTANQRERNLTASGGQLHVSGQHPLLHHQNRRQSCPPHFQCQPSIRPSAEHHLEPSQSPSQHEAEDVQGSHPADVAVWSEDLEGVQEAGAKTQSLSPQLSSVDTEAEIAGSDPGNGCTGADGNLQHQRYAETATIALE
ncbi:hypothetical protein SprV_0200767700 [Sparganum proliferum]